MGEATWLKQAGSEGGKTGHQDSGVVSSHQECNVITSRDRVWRSTKLISFHTRIKLELIQTDCVYAVCSFVNDSISFFFLLFIFLVKMSPSTNMFKGTNRISWCPSWGWYVD